MGDVSSWTGPLIIQTHIGIDELLKRSLRIYPNPSNGVFNMEFSSALGEDIEIRIINVLGQILREERLSPTELYWLDLSNRPQGLYLLQLRQNGRLVAYHKLMVKP